MACRHISWLEIVEDHRTGEKAIDNPTRLDRIIQELPDPRNQVPRLVHFIGTKGRDRALKYIFPQNNFGRRYEKGNINLRVDNTSINTPSPLLIADSNPFHGFIAKRPQATCHATHPHTISWTTNGDTITDVLFSRLVFPFSDLICVFADDFTGLEGVAQRILSWISIGNSVQENKPQLLIVMSEEEPLDSLQDEDFRFILHSNDGDVREKFSMIKIFRLAGEYLSPLARYQRLKDQVYNLTEKSLSRRKDDGYAFSALHLVAFFDSAIMHTAKTRTQPFDFIAAFKLGKMCMSDDMDYAKSFLKLALKYKTPYEGIACFLASCILVDAYPPRTHNFPPRKLFDSIYRDPVFKMLNEDFTGCCAQYVMSLIKTDLAEFYKEMETGKTSLELHQENMHRLAHFFAAYRTNMSCLFCLARSPERHLSCGHSLCDTCVRRFGKGVMGREDRFTVTCIFKDSGMLIADLKPMTAGVRILSVDGGGTRGVAPLAECEMIQELMPGCPLHEQIDYTAGSSSGGYIILGIFYKQWSPHKCNQLFLSMAKRCFHESRNVYGCIKCTLRWLISDGYYDESVLESMTQEMFPGRLFDHLPDTISGTRFALTATSKGNSRWIFGNYNAATPNPRNDYDLVRVEDLEHEAHAWEAGRATSAAPVFFKPIQMHSGTYWDGGLVFPDPVELALFESERLWPESIPDVIVSLGTGIQPKAKGGRRSLYRLWASFMDMLDGQSHSRDTGKVLEKHTRGSFFRLNTILQRPTRLDSTDDLEELRKTVHLSPASRMDTRNVALALLSSNFYLTLDDRPIFESGLYRYDASIRCRTDCKAVISALGCLSSSTMQFVTQNEVLGDCGLNDTCHVCFRYRKRVTIVVRHPDDFVTISVGTRNKFVRKISGFPQRMSWFEEKGNLNDTFGNQDHDIPGALQCSTCSPQTDKISGWASRCEKRLRT